MTYKFTDTTETGSVALPSEGICVDGLWLDQEIPGYKTLSVQGRELVPVLLDDLTGLGVNRQYDARTIVVTYMLKSSSASEQRETFNRLSALLFSNENEASRFTFADEPDKYFTGLISEHEDPEPGLLCAVGRFTITCSDPHKYSLLEKKETTNTQIINTVNEGTVAVPVKMPLSLSSACGYIGIKLNGKTQMEYGDVSDPESETFSNAVVTLVNEQLATQQTLYSASTGGTDLVHDTHWTGGSFERIGADLTTTASADARWLALNASSITNASVGYAVGAGALAQFTIPADSNGDRTGTTSWKVEWDNWFQGNGHAQRGSQGVTIVTADNIPIASFYVYKANTSNADSYIEIKTYQGDAKTQKIDSDGAYDTAKPYTGNPFCLGAGHVTMTKVAGRIDVTVRGMSFTLFSAAITDLEAAKIQVAIKGYKDIPALTRNYIGGFNFTKRGVVKGPTEWTTYCQTFGHNHKNYEMNTETGSFYVEGVESFEYEAIGTEYFLLPPGPSSIELVVSDWYKGTISFGIEYKEAWL